MGIYAVAFAKAMAFGIQARLAVTDTADLEVLQRPQ